MVYGLPIVYNLLDERCIHILYPMSSFLFHSGQGFLDVSSTGVNISQTSYPAREPLNLPAMTFLEEEGIVVGRVNRVNLVLGPSVLVPGLRYSFRLTATHNSSTTHSEVTITANPPPQTTTLTIQPSVGTALNTEFRLTVERATDSVADQPLLYQFGILQDQTLYWLTGPLTTKFAVLQLPAGMASNGNSIQVVGRVHDSRGGHSDSVSNVTVMSNTAATGNNFYQTHLQTARSSLQSRKDWNKALAILTSSLLNLNTAPNSVTSAALSLLSDIYYHHLPVTRDHQTTIIPILELMTNKLTIEGTSDRLLITSICNSIVSQLDLLANTNLGSIQTGVSVVSGVPTPLTSDRYGLEMLKELLDQEEAQSLLQTWGNLVSSDWDPSMASAIINGMRNLSNLLCKQMVVGEQTIMAAGGSLRIKTEKTTPIGAFRTGSGAVVDFGSTIESIYESQACPDVNTACSEVCLQSMDYTEDYFSASNSQVISLQEESSRMILTQIEGSDPSSIELFSDIVSLDFFVPVQDRLLNVQNVMSKAVKVYIPARSSAMPNGSISLCLHRGPTSGSNQQWQLDSLQQPTTVTIEGRSYHLCSFNHLTEFAIGLLPPPIITLPPSTTTVPPSSTPMPTLTSSAVPIVSMTPSPTLPMPTSDTGVIAAAIIIILLLIVAAVAIALIVAVLVWRKKKSRTLKIAPSESAEAAEQAPVEGKLFEKKPLTPEEAKTPVRVIQLLDNGERTLLGTVRIIPSMRLRELRNNLVESFNDLKEKPFYLCTKELCDIEPASEQQQFVSIVYSGVVFIRNVKLDNPLTRHQFCICGKAAQFECSSCNAQGYCSQECQQKHWTKEHQKLCSRLSERKHRSEVLLRRQLSTNVLPNVPEQPSSTLHEETDVQHLEHPVSPTDWKTFLSASKSTRLPPLPKKASTTSTPSQRFPQSPERKKEEQDKEVTPQPPSTSNQSSLETPLSPSRPSRPPLTSGGRSSTISIGKLASQGTIPLPPSRPLYPPASHISYHRRISTHTPLLTPGAQPTLVRPGVLSPPPTAASMASYLSPTPLYGSYTSQQLQQSLAYSQMLQQQQTFQSNGPSQAFFRPSANVRPPLMSPQAHPQFNRGWSVTSVGSADINMGTGTYQRRDIRNEPLLEHEDESSGSSSQGEETKPATAGPSSGGRPPSLSVRKRHSRMESRKSESESSDSESSGDSDSDT